MVWALGLQLKALRFYGLGFGFKILGFRFYVVWA